jgi:protein required for attachment to host cells
MNKLSIPHDAAVFVGDGQKALFLRNTGDVKYPNLITENVFTDENPPAHEQGTDRPGRAFKRAATNRRSVEITDWHGLEKHRFVEHVGAAIEKLVRAERVKALVIVAPPRTFCLLISHYLR